MMKRFWRMMPAMLVMAGGMVACSSDDGDDVIDGEMGTVSMIYPENRIALSTEEWQFVNANNAFALNLFQQISENDGPKSSFCSPISVTYLLGMLNAGAEGATRQEIQDALGFGTGDAAAVNEYCEKLLKQAPQLDPKVTLNIANSIFVNNAICKINPWYQREMQQYYEAEVSDMDFGNVRNVDVINQWADDKTEGMIPHVLDDDEFSPGVVMFLLNAIYFKADWTEKFSEKYTKKADFIGDQGTRQVDMMHQKVIARYGETADCSVLNLPYGDGAFSMKILLPKQGKSVEQAVAGLNSGMLNDVNMSACEVDVKIPRWKTSTNIPLIPVLQQMGIRQMFNWQTSELTNMTDGGSLYVSMMKQLAKIDVNESGSEAAAVTVAAVNLSSAGSDEPKELQKVTFHANRPFVYLITERSTGVVFFIGKYTGD